MQDKIVMRGHVFMVAAGDAHIIFFHLEARSKGDSKASAYLVPVKVLARYHVDEGDSFVIFEHMGVYYLSKVANLQPRPEELSAIRERLHPVFDYSEMHQFKKLFSVEEEGSVAEKIVEYLLPKHLVEQIAMTLGDHGENPKVVH